MTSFRNAYPVETAELDSAVEAADGYRELHKRLADDDLPRFQEQFKTYLNQNTIREIAQFQAQLIRQSDLIRERIDTINDVPVRRGLQPGPVHQAGTAADPERRDQGLPRRPAGLHRRRRVPGSTATTSTPSRSSCR